MNIKREGVLGGGQQYGIDDAILARPVGYSGVSNLSLDDSALGEDVPSHVVQIGLVILNRLNLYALGLAGHRIGDYGHIAPQHTHLDISALGLDLLNPDRGNGGIALL